MHTTGSITQLVGGRLTGPDDIALTGVQTLSAADENQLAFISDPRYAPQWANARCRAVLVNRGIALPPRNGAAAIEVENADLAMALVLEMFAPQPHLPGAGVHPSAVIDGSAVLGKDVRIGPLCVIGPRVWVGDGCILHASVNLMADCAIGSDCELFPGVVIGQRCTLGDRCILHPNVNIGADGFGYRPDPRKKTPVKIPQIGVVRIGSDVELGAGACIDRGKFAATVVGDHCKIDNLVQIGHNCVLGPCVLIAGMTGIAGSVTIEAGAVLGGAVHVGDHLTIGAGAQVAGGTQLMHSVPAGETWAGSPGQPIRDAARQELALRKLPEVLKQLKRGG
ncbi:MAG: UDP-3-O-(3-hydroxymyristoyl)glucosamine N-acyltransferase [Phycisphaeraceae bacterium]|nr:UDP-3-O-(3-hydroxymyristoyl)glucosamine N-acyltransferase [Phycisphaeraceae bacterium]